MKLSSGQLSMDDYRINNVANKIGWDLTYKLLANKNSGNISLEDKQIIAKKLWEEYQNPFNVYESVFWDTYPFHVWQLANSIEDWSNTPVPELIENKILIYSKQKEINQYNFAGKEVLVYSNEEKEYIIKTAKNNWLDISNFKIDNSTLDHWEILSMIFKKSTNRSI